MTASPGGATDLLLIHAGATLALVGLIWFVQVVHYPLFKAVGRPGFRDYERRHATRTSYVVIPLMLTELATSVLLVLPAWRNQLAEPGLAWIGLALVALVWVSTFALQVPQHRALTQGFDAKAASRLVATNWIRTVAWTTRGVIALLLLR